MPRKHKKGKKRAAREASGSGKSSALGKESKTALVVSKKKRKHKRPAASVANQPQSGPLNESGPLMSAQWTHLRSCIRDDRHDWPVQEVFGTSGGAGVPFRWGLSTSNHDNKNLELQWLSRIACDRPTKASRFGGIEPIELLEQFHDSLGNSCRDLREASMAVCWAAAMPGLTCQLDENHWWSLLGMLKDYREVASHQDPTSPFSLIGVAELGLVLAHRLRALPSCRRLCDTSIATLSRWCEQGELAITSLLTSPVDARLTLASILRQRVLLDSVVLGKPKKSNRKAKHRKASVAEQVKENLKQIGIELATWLIATARKNGSPALSYPTEIDSRDDIGRDGLLVHAAQLQPQALLPALYSMLGSNSVQGKLSWQIALPETMMHDEDARFACLLPDWDARRGRTVIDYSQSSIRMELLAGQSACISGAVETEFEIDGELRGAVSDWIVSCEYSDDDVHYLELEQVIDGGFVVQRQIMLVREDRCVLFADAVVENHPSPNGTVQQTSDSEALPRINYRTRIPIRDSMTVQQEEETRELFLSGSRPQAMVIPLSANEWRCSRSQTTLQVTEDQHLLVKSEGLGRLYTPLWFDLSRRRFKLPRTWRQLTVGHQLQMVPSHVASAYRIQSGSSHWILYRSLEPSTPRTFFGKQLNTDFYCARFDAKEQSYEDLITVENEPN